MGVVTFGLLPVSQADHIVLDDLLHGNLHGGAHFNVVDVMFELVGMLVQIGECLDSSFCCVIRNAQADDRVVQVGLCNFHFSLLQQGLQHGILLRNPGPKKSIHFVVGHAVVGDRGADLQLLAGIAQCLQNLRGNFGLHRNTGPGRDAEFNGVSGEGVGTEQEQHQKRHQNVFR